MSKVKEIWNSERLRKVLLSVGVVYVLVISTVIVWQQYHYYKVQSGFHKQTVQILNEHTNTLSEVHALRTEVTKLVQQYGPDLTAGQQQIVAEYTWIACSLQNGPTRCGAVPAP